MNDPGRPRTFCRFTATIQFNHGPPHTIVEDEPQLFSDVYEHAGELIAEQCFIRARYSTGYDHPVSIDLRVHTFETECTE